MSNAQRIATVLAELKTLWPSMPGGNRRVVMAMEEAHEIIGLLAAEVEALRKENERLRKALASVIAACDQGRMVPRPGSGVGGMTVDANIRSSIYTGVPAWPVEEARAALQGRRDE